jgi:hypothetical protein
MHDLDDLVLGTLKFVALVALLSVGAVMTIRVLI